MIFLSNENLEQIVTIFGEYMRDKYNINVVTNTADNIPDLTLKMMRIVAANAQGVESVKDLNVQVLGQLRKYYLNKLNAAVPGPHARPVAPQQPAVLIRDDAVFRDRKVVFKDNIPEDTSINKKSVDLSKKMEALEARRNAEFVPQRPPSPEPAQVMEKAESMEEFLAKVKQLELEREQAPSGQASQATQAPGPTPAPMSYLTHSVSNQQQSIQPFQPLPQVNVNRNLRVARNSLASLTEGLYYIKCLSVKYKTDDFDHILSIRLSVGPDAPVVFRFADYSLVGDRATVMYEPIFPNEKINIDPEVVLNTDWEGYTLVTLLVVR